MANSTYMWLLNGVPVNDEVSNQIDISSIPNYTRSSIDEFSVLMTPDPSLCLTQPFVRSNVVSVQIDPLPVTGTITPSSENLCYGEQNSEKQKHGKMIEIS